MLPFSTLNKYFLDTLVQKIFFFIIKINNFRGELTDNSDKKEALPPTEQDLLPIANMNSRSIIILIRYFSKKIDVSM